MANNNEGLIYYNVDTDRRSDAKIRRLKRKCGAAGFGIYNDLLDEIYRTHGCYLEVDENILFALSDENGIDEVSVTNIIIECCEIGLFNKEDFENHNILTSNSIQQRYQKICKQNRWAATGLKSLPTEDTALDNLTKLICNIAEQSTFSDNITIKKERKKNKKNQPENFGSSLVAVVSEPAEITKNCKVAEPAEANEITGSEAPARRNGGKVIFDKDFEDWWKLYDYRSEQIKNPKAYKVSVWKLWQLLTPEDVMKIKEHTPRYLRAFKTGFKGKFTPYYYLQEKTFTGFIEDAEPKQKPLKSAEWDAMYADFEAQKSHKNATQVDVSSQGETASKIMTNVFANVLDETLSNFETDEECETRLTEKLNDFVAKMPANCSLVASGNHKARDLKKLDDIIDGIGASDWDYVKDEFGYFCDYYSTYSDAATTLLAFFRRTPSYRDWWLGKCKKYNGD
jgi:hypothetical protein